MIPRDCKRLAEVDFPIAEVSKHVALEKSIRHGHRSTLHLWWSWRPLASSHTVLMAHPAVHESATIGIPDPERGETVKSFVVLCPGQAALADDLIAHCRRGLAAYKIPRSIEFLDELPRSSALKILRRELREREIAAAAGRSRSS